ncbi:hypothetical protein G6F57_009488 [Rhizopus arrhizus]|uniref:Uncharacterized protein n=1 Tax=Rhizopus oryzae TaxID=64495 RepID=A0A9P6X331_RHIOR|nr:hypothetical protein G6F23_006785 [Rhizopus arrhizus]KAG1420228.1 hypothetical protein G6F58_004274 [Rhizopus delemar]KAG0758981.1 hypothetical protein G6F24_009401 [Rhizopus arrhizus]KAG0794263.1 hypothetical protein G6F21_002990 [Rhizopus arrhizus]KAG0795037.1 hypothetical protein G6F22_005207 [Rhizopus arrhizus]
MVQSSKTQRVPTFIQFPTSKTDDTEAPSVLTKRRPGRPKKNTARNAQQESVVTDVKKEPVKDKVETRKRKRERKTTVPKPKKKTTKVSSVSKLNLDEEEYVLEPEDMEIEEQTKDEIWVGAAFEDGRGSYSIYFGEKDNRNISVLCNNELRVRDLDYVYVLATAEAIERSKQSKLPLIVYTGCRDLPRAISEGNGHSHQAELIDRICQLIKEKDDQVQVRHVSSRNLSKEQRIALDMAVKTLDNAEQTGENHQQEVEEAKQNEIKEEEQESLSPQEDIGQETPSPSEQSSEDIKEMSETIEYSDNDNIKTNRIEEINEVDMEVDKEVETSIVVKETAEIENDICMQEPVELKKEESQPELPRASSWSAMFGSIWDTLSSPFKSNK